ncbi:hypothetical protein AB0F25_30370 [Streptomyces wedmorensis]|uniref:hypothetical protein n=1 Tax=Streptomyces wedmorensis TaxID=43759 RepID=UPI00343B212B
MAERRSGQALADKVGETPGFTIRPANGLKVVVSNRETGEQRTIPLEASGREYDNAVKKLRSIGWTVEFWEAAMEVKRFDRIQRSQGEADELKAFQEEAEKERPKPALAGVDKVMHKMLTDLLSSLDGMKSRVRNLHEDNLHGKAPTAEQAMDLLFLQSAIFDGSIGLSEELRRRGLVAKSMRP